MNQDILFCLNLLDLLFELVGHVRAAHTANCNLNFVCQVKVEGCPRIFKKANTWYKHVLAEHKDEYFKKEVSISPAPKLADQEMEDLTMFLDDGGEGSSTSVEPPDVSNDSCSPNFVTQDMAAGMLLKLKEKHKLSQAAIDEVIDVVGVITEDVITKTLSAVKQSAESHGVDVTTPFFRNLPNITDSLSNPLTILGTAYRHAADVCLSKLTLCCKFTFIHYCMH